MTLGLAFWGPFLAIFGAALIISVVQRYARDICLMRFNHDHVVLRMKDGKWIWGTLRVHSKALEITYCDPVLGPNGEEHLTHILSLDLPGTTAGFPESPGAKTLLFRSNRIPLFCFLSPWQS